MFGWVYDMYTSSNTLNTLLLLLFFIYLIFFQPSISLFHQLLLAFPLSVPSLVLCILLLSLHLQLGEFSL